ncbi:MAG TPA: hypothetical protein VHE61_21955 [Opitutaceae bacterium]|nr:hypothetical protein [Opitutaceae bacterium]
MKATFLTDPDGADALALGELPAPQPQTGDVLIRVHTAAITPTERSWFPRCTWRTDE